MKDKVKSHQVKPISIRLPPPVLAKIDRQAEVFGTDRTDIVRRAVATYFRLADSLLVPTSQLTKRQLEDLAEFRGVPTDELAETLFARAVARECEISEEKVTKFKSVSTSAKYKADEENYFTATHDVGVEVNFNVN